LAIKSIYARKRHVLPRPMLNKKAMCFFLDVEKEKLSRYFLTVGDVVTTKWLRDVIS